MNALGLRSWFAQLLAAAVLGSSVAALAGQTPDDEAKKEEAKRLAELQARLLGADLVVRARVANVLPVGDEVLVVLGVRETFRGATARRAIYVETAKANAAGLEGQEALWLLKATDDPRHFLLDGPDAILEVERAGQITKALEAIEYASLDQLKLTVALDKGAYKLDEPIRLTWTIENPTEKPIVIAVPRVWGAGLGISLKSAAPQGKTILSLGPRSRAGNEGQFSFHTLMGEHRSVTGTASLLRLVAGHRQADAAAEGSLLPPESYVLKLSSDTTGAAGNPDVAVPKEAALGSLESSELAFEVTAASLSSPDEAKALIAQFAGVEDIEKALESDDAGIRARAIEAVRDYACPALLPLLAKMLRSDDAEAQAAACSAITMWARHPAVVAARPFEELLEKAPIGKDLSVIARAAADVAEAQQDATMIPLLLRYLYDEKINTVSKQSIALSIGAIAGLDINESDLDEATATIARWVKEHSGGDTAPEGE
jgi:hypothetical protein